MSVHDKRRPAPETPITRVRRPVRPDWKRIHRSDPAWWWQLILGPFSRLYGLGVSLRLLAYRLCLLKRKHLDGFVLSVGNLTTGGTGKTPAVVTLAEWAAAEGYRAAVLSRGYGGSYEGKVFALSDGGGPCVGSRVAGDEPVLLAHNLQGVPVVLSRKRYLAGVYAREKFGADFFILDDGFQHIGLKRDLDVVLMDAVDPFGNGRLLPFGPLREPVQHLERADVFIVTRSGENAGAGRWLAAIHRRFPSTPVFFADHKPVAVVFPDAKSTFRPGYVRGKRVVAFAGLARPEVFQKSLEELGARVVHFEGFNDHHTFTKEEITALGDKKTRTKADCMLTTEKDWWRLGEDVRTWKDMGYLKIEFNLLAGKDSLFELIRDHVRKAGAAA